MITSPDSGPHSRSDSATCVADAGEAMKPGVDKLIVFLGRYFCVLHICDPPIKISLFFVSTASSVTAPRSRFGWTSRFRPKLSLISFRSVCTSSASALPVRGATSSGRGRQVQFNSVQCTMTCRRAVEKSWIPVIGVKLSGIVCLYR